MDEDIQIIMELKEEIVSLKTQIEQLERNRQHEYYEDSASYYRMVKKFHEKFGLHIEDGPIDFALENDAGNNELFHLRHSLHVEEWKELQESYYGEDLVAFADAVCDLIYVLCGSCVSFGIDLDRCFAEVHRSNMTKLDTNGNPIVREDGKILKSEAFSPPDLRSIIYGSQN